MFVVWFVVALYSWAWPDVSLSGGDKINKGEKGVVPSILISSTPFFSMTFAAKRHRILSIMAANGEMKEVGYAVELKDAFKSYGSLDVLKGLDMSVPYGSM